MVKHPLGLALAFACVSGAYSQTGGTVHLTLQQASAQALQNHPQVLAAKNAAAAMGQQVVEAKAPYYPVVAADATSTGANQQARIGAGAISASRIINRFASGVNFNQLVTDWGRTPNLVATARFRSDAGQQTYQATRYDVLLRVNQAYFGALRAQATINVARETVAARQLIVDLVTALYNNKLRSELDVSFANVSLSQGQLLLIQAQDLEQQAFAELTRALGAQQNATYALSEEPLPPSPPPNAESLVAQALGARPELAALRSERDAAYRFERAEHDLMMPSVSLVGLSGYIPYINQITLPRVIPNEYAGAALDVHIPIFNGRLLSARREEAHFRALEADQRLRDEEQVIARDVRTAWASVSTAYQRLGVADQLLREASLGRSLAEGRYQLGLASVVELTQAQLQVTEAQIESLTAKYDYQSQYAGLQYTLGALR